MTDEYYIGYKAKAPAGIAAWTRAAVLLTFLLAAGVAALCAVAQRSYGSGVFEFGRERELRGIVEEWPAPSLRMEAGNGRWIRVPVVLPGKHGAVGLFAGKQGKRVTLSGTLIYRDGRAMLEARPDSLAEDIQPSKPVPATHEDLGAVTLRGEIVDSKCYLGVMNPGSGKTHKACATLCIRGGIPPVFLVRREDGTALYFHLCGADGRALNAEILDLVAEPLEITGTVERWDDLLVLKAEPTDFVLIHE